MQKDDRIFAAVGACIVAAVALVAALMWLGSGINVDAPQRATVTVPPHTVPTPEASKVSAPRVTEAHLSDDREDGLVRAAVERFSGHPVLAAYLVNDRLLRRFVLAVDAVAGGYSPSDQIEFMRPAGPFIVREDDGRLVVASSTYHRYDLVSDVFTSIDTDAAVEIFERFLPQMETLYTEVGWADDGFETRLREAVEHLLEVPTAAGQVEVEQRAIVYAYAEDRFEDLTDAQKHLLRMGPRNVGAIQSKLRELQDAMGWPEPPPAIVSAENEQVSEHETTAAPLVADASPALATDRVIEPVGAAGAP
jgi:hypothetical protein